MLATFRDREQQELLRLALYQLRARNRANGTGESRETGRKLSLKQIVAENGFRLGDHRGGVIFSDDPMISGMPTDNDVDDLTSSVFEFTDVNLDIISDEPPPGALRIIGVNVQAESSKES